MFHKNKLITLSLIILLAACNQSLQPLEAKADSKGHSLLLNEHIVQISKTNDGELSKKDLARFADKIAGARIVGLGEQTHGTSEVFTLKSQLIQYLHQEHGYEVFILESGLYEVNTLWQQAKKGKRIKDNANGNIFYMYANTKEVTPLFDYINQMANTDKPLTLAGFDSQHTGKLSNKNLVKDLERVLIESQYDLPENWSVFKQQLQHVLNISTERLSAEHENDFFTQLTRIQQALLVKSKKPKSANINSHYNQTGLWYRIARGLEAQAKRQWQISDTRSQEMGENIKWWASQYPNKKIIVWAHSGHLFRTGIQQINAGQVVSESFAEQYYMVHFTGNDGEFLNFVDMKAKSVSDTTENSFEQIVTKASKANISFVNVVSQSLLAPELKKKNTTIMTYDYQNTMPLNQWGSKMDGVFVFKAITPAQYEQR